jgi:hypothetical protein
MGGMRQQRITPTTVEFEDLLQISEADGTEPFHILG